MWHKEKSRNPIVRLALLLALASTPMVTGLLKSNYVLAQSPAETPSFPLPTAVPLDTTIRIDGSASMTRANESLKQSFEKEYSGSKVELATNGTDDALKALQEGKIDIAAIGRGLTPEEEKLGLEQQRLRREKIAIIVGKDNPFKGDLSNQKFTQIYRGEITDWSEIGGSSGKIRVLDRPNLSDTRQAFRNYPLFKGDLTTGSTATQLDSDDPAEVVKQLGDDGIGFVLANQVSKLDNVRILSMHKVLPNDPRYPYSQPLVYVFKKNPSEAVKNFVGYATAKPGQAAIETAREQEAEAVATAVAQAVSGDANTATPGATPGTTTAAKPDATTGAVATPGNTEDAAADGQAAGNGNEVASGGADTEGVETATNTSATDGNSTAFVPGDSAGASAEAGTIPWWWILLPVAALGALVMWWLLGRRKSQEDDTVARGVLPKDSPPPFTPTSTNTSGVVKEPEPVVNTPIEPNAGINAAGIAAGAAGLGLGAAALSSRGGDDRENPENQDIDISQELRVDTPDLQQPEISTRGLNLDLEAPDLPQADIDISENVELPDWNQTDIPDTSLDLEAPAAVVNTSYPSLPRISTPTDGETSNSEPGEDTPSEDNNDTSSQQELPPASTNNWLGNFALGAGATAAGAGAAAAAGAERIKSKLAGKEVAETPEDESAKDSAEISGTAEYPQLPDVWGTPQTEQPAEEENEKSSSSFLGNATAGAAGLAAGAAAIGSGLFNRDNPDNAEENDDNDTEEQSQTISPSDLWETPQTKQPEEEEEKSSLSFLDNAAAGAAAIGSGLSNRDNPDNAAENDDNDTEEQPQITSPSDLWGTPQTAQPEDEEEKSSSSFLGNAAAGAAGLAAGAAAIGSGFFNRGNKDTSDESNNTEENNHDDDVEQPKEQQDSASSSSGLGSGWFLNRFRNNTETTDNTENQPVVEEESPVSNSELPEIRITNSEEQSGDAQTSSQEQPTVNGLPNVWVTPSNQPANTTEETTEEQIAQFGASSASVDNPASTGGAVLAGGAALGAAALGSQMLNNDEESQQQAALDEVADEAELDTEDPASGQSSDAESSDWDKVYGIQSHGASEIPAQSSILLTNRTPKWAYASWNIADSDREAMRERGANQLVLRLYDVTGVDLSYQNAKLVQQYECEEIVTHRYVAIPNTERDYITEIGYLTEDKDWLLVSRSPIIRVFNRPHKDFWFEADAELIIHGATEPGSNVTIDGQNIKVKQDGTFHLRVPFTESLINYLITAVASDSEQARTIHMQFSQAERKNS